MQEEHRKSIQRNFSSLVEQTDLDQMVLKLYEKGVFSEQMIEPYQDTNKDPRSRKRELYMDIMRRGPQAFQNLLEALSEVGVWDLVRELDPNSALHYSRYPPPPLRNLSSSNKGSSRSRESNYVSISEEKKKTKIEKEINESAITAPTRLPVGQGEIPHFHIMKSTKFYEDDGDEFKLYRTRGRQRGVLLMFSYTEFRYEQFRRGAEADSRNLKYLFDEFGFSVVGYNNLTRQATLNTLKSLRQVGYVHTAECVFVVVSSHGHEVEGHSDINICCHDDDIRVYEFIDFFSNRNFPELKGKPKVFIFQICRGFKGRSQSTEQEWDGAGDQADAVEQDTPSERGEASGERGEAPAEQDGAPGGARQRDGAGGGAPHAVGSSEKESTREYSDILVVNSTVPGFVANRDPVKGSWYIQTLCKVFAARAHERHVHDLLTLVDQHLARDFPGQTSSYDNWGFNRRLYLHPGLFEEDPAPPASPPPPATRDLAGPCLPQSS